MKMLAKIHPTWGLIFSNLFIVWFFVNFFKLVWLNRIERSITFHLSLQMLKLNIVIYICFHKYRIFQQQKLCRKKVFFVKGSELWREKSNFVLIIRRLCDMLSILRLCMLTMVGKCLNCLSSGSFMGQAATKMFFSYKNVLVHF